MQLTQAIQLIEKKKSLVATTTHWADLGCGTGRFTHALAQLLPAGSTIHAVDTDKEALRHLPQPPSVQIIPHVFNFEKDPWPFNNLDGVLMANSLHYVADKRSFIQQIQPCLRPEHLLMIIEYDRERGNLWVPYPVTYQQLSSLLQELGYHRISKLGEHPSRYGDVMIYASLAQK